MACQYSGFGSQYYKRKLGGEIESAEKNFNSSCGCVVPSTSSIEAKKKNGIRPRPDARQTLIDI